MIWRYLVRPALFLLPPEGAHNLSMVLFNAGMVPPVARLVRGWLVEDDPRLKTDLFGCTFANPVGLAAGFDKYGLWFNSLSHLGFSHVEVGTVTGQRQPGNPKPRLFRLPRDRALINRMGFNNPGAEELADRLRGARALPILGINLGKTRQVSNTDAADDYLHSLNLLFSMADYFTINVSSPNTPGLRQLQERRPLMELLGRLIERNRALASRAQTAPKPILLKIAPDLNEAQLDDLIAIAGETDIAGLIATNTTTARSPLESSPVAIQRAGEGGLSGAPLKCRSQQVVRHLYRGLRRHQPIIGVGGIMSGEDAWQMIRAGASLVQIYTGFVYGGPGIVRQINRYLGARLREQGLDCISQAVGQGV